MFFSNNTQLESKIQTQSEEIDSLKQEVESLNQKNKELEKQARYADSNKVMNELIKSLTHGLTDGCDRDLKLIQTDLESNLSALEDIDGRNQQNNEHTNACTIEIDTLSQTMSSLWVITRNVLTQ